MANSINEGRLMNIHFGKIRYIENELDDFIGVSKEIRGQIRRNRKSWFEIRSINKTELWREYSESLCRFLGEHGENVTVEQILGGYEPHTQYYITEWHGNGGCEFWFR